MKNGAFRETFSGANKRLSSKRIIGGIILMVLLVVIVINTFYGPRNTWIGEAFITMIVGAFALFGIGVFEKNYGTFKKKNEDDDDEDEEDFDFEETIEDKPKKKRRAYKEEDMCT